MLVFCLDQFDWSDRPSWAEVGEGIRPIEIKNDGIRRGEWSHGWQFHASEAIDKYRFDLLLHRFYFPSMRKSASSPSQSTSFFSMWCVCSVLASNLSFFFVVRIP